MQVTFNGETQDANVELRRAQGPADVDQLFVDGTEVVRVTHSHADDVPVVLVLDEHQTVEVDRAAFYVLGGMDQDWQPQNPERAEEAKHARANESNEPPAEGRPDDPMAELDQAQQVDQPGEPPVPVG